MALDHQAITPFPEPYVIVSHHTALQVCYTSRACSNTDFCESSYLIKFSESFGLTSFAVPSSMIPRAERTITLYFPPPPLPSPSYSYEGKAGWPAGGGGKLYLN